MAGEFVGGHAGTRDPGRTGGSPVCDAGRTGGSPVHGEAVPIPHDWAIAGPFSETKDLQLAKIVQESRDMRAKKDHARR